ncbi:MAG: T9SS type A sorting domain-containing protein, partial [Candidatus Neomarinimicrobiota bacterium]
GDINGDGYDDLCYGPREYSGAFLYKGSNLEYQDHIRLSIYLGGDDLSWMPDTTITPPRFLLNSDSHGYDWYNCTGLGDINHDGYDDFSMQYFEICIPASGAKLCDSVMYVYYGNNDLSNIINSVDTLVVGDIRGELGKISDVYSKAFFCQNKDTLEQIPGMNIVYGNDMNAFVMHYNKNDIGNITPGDINNDGYNDWIIWDNNDAQIKGYFGGSQLDNEFDFITPDAFVFNCGTENEYYDKESNFYILGDICGDGFDKILFTEKIDDQYYDLYCFSYNEVKTRIKDIVPESYELLTIYPNPFNPTTTIEYHLSTSGNVDLSIYNVLGMKEVTLFNNTREVGSYNLQFNAQSLGSGIYLCVLQVNNEIVSTKKLLLMK